MSRIKVLICSLLFYSCFVGEELPPDQDTWEYGQPSEVGFVDSLLLDLNAAVGIGSFDPVRSMIIIKDDKLVSENYYFGDDRSTMRNIGRSSPLLAILALGIAIDEGFVQNLDDQIHDLLPIQYRGFLTDEKREITLRHLLEHRSGFSWNETIFGEGLNSPLNDLNLMQSSLDPIAYILEKPLEAPPGVRFNLNTGTVTVVAKIIEEAVGVSFIEFVDDRIMQNLGITQYEWQTDLNGNVNAATGLAINTLDLTKIGYLYLQGGIWEEEVIVSDFWIEQIGSTQVEITNTFNYGYYWYTFSDNLQFIPTFDPNDTYFFPQHIYINPSQQLVITFGTESVFLNTVSSPMLLYREVITRLTF